MAKQISKLWSRRRLLDSVIDYSMQGLGSNPRADIFDETKIRKKYFCDKFF